MKHREQTLSAFMSRYANTVAYLNFRMHMVHKTNPVGLSVQVV